MEIAKFFIIATGLLLADSQFPDFISRQAKKNICPAVISVVKHFPAATHTLTELPRGYPTTLGHFPTAFLYPSNSAQRLCDNNL
jgi:hypothetical protein